VGHATVPGTIVHDLATRAGGLPELVIDDAYFQVDLAKVFGPSGSAGARTIRDIVADIRSKLVPQHAAIHALTGTITATLETGYLDVPLDIHLRGGRVDVDTLVSGAVRGTPVLGMSVESGHTLVLHANVPVYNPITGGITVVEVPILSWHLSSGEMRDYKRSGEVDLLRLLDPSGTKLVLDTTVGGGAPSPSAIRLRDIAGDLSMISSGPIPVPLGSHGRLVMAPSAVAHLVIRGNVGGSVAGPPGGPAVVGRPGLIVAAMERATVQEAHLIFGGTTVDTGVIEMTKLHDCRLSFSDFEPRVLSGTLTQATAKNIRWQLP
jgi:hypothetical protein